MNRDALARAMTEIDDELIAQSFEFSKISKRNLQVKKLSAVAACFVVIVAALSAFLLGSGTKVSVYGTVVSGNPVAISTTQNARAMTQELSVPLEIKATGKVVLKAQSGELYTASSSFGEKEIEESGSFSVRWTVENAEVGQEYFLTVSDKTDLLLSFDESLNKWTIKLLPGGKKS